MTTRRLTIILLVSLFSLGLGCSDSADKSGGAPARPDAAGGMDAGTDAAGERDASQEAPDVADTRDDAAPDAEPATRCSRDNDCVRAPNQAAVCDVASGQCHYVCDPGFADCDADIRTGCEADLSADVAHCGSCGHACLPGNLALRPVCVTPDGEAPRCTFDPQQCADGFVDLNGQPGDGCECEITDPNDVPDPAGDDSNCDGIDGTLERAVFVAGGLVAAGAGDGEDGGAPVGDDAASGLTPDQPVRTIARGLDIAASRGRDYILVTAGTYEEVVELRSGIGIHGGYTYELIDGSARWSRGAAGGVDASLTRIAPRADVVDPGEEPRLAYYRSVIAANLTIRTVLGGLTIVGMDARAPGATSTALWAHNAQGLALNNVVVQAGAGAPGKAGKVASEPTQCTAFKGGLGAVDAPVTPCSMTLPAYAQDGKPGNPTATDAPGRGGDEGTGGAHACQDNATNCGNLNGTSGQPGQPGSDGAHGDAAPAAPGSIGALSATGWTPATGSPAQPGTRGAGGGGGGAGGRCEVNGGCFGPFCGPNTMYNGGNGGTGGDGGCGGAAGENGQPGGASFGIVAVDSALVFSQLQVKLGAGGKGGDGGEGSVGAIGTKALPGAKGGEQDAFGTKTMRGGKGGDGGQGGDGGKGGDGAGGCGGPSIGLATLNSSTNPQDATFSSATGQAGAPGQGAGGAPLGCAGTLKTIHNYSTP